MRVARRYHGFTLVELLVAMVVLGIVTAASVTAISRLGRVKDLSLSRQRAFARAGTAADQIAADVMSAVRHPNLAYSLVRVTDGGSGDAEADEILLLTRAISRVRGLYGEAEGGDFEVQYRVSPGESGGVLWRRADPALDSTVSGGGVAAPIAPGILSLSIRAFDGELWYDAWDSDADGMPHGVRIEVRATDDSGRSTAVARRLVALDRVPLLPLEEGESL